MKSSSLSENQQPVSFFEHEAERLRTTAEAIGFGAKAAGVVELFRKLISPWGEQPITARPEWHSDVGEDHTPYEFSIALGGPEPELRILLEAQAKEKTLEAYWKAGQALSELLAQEVGADLTRLRQIEDLFVPQDGEALFSVWHAICFWPSRPPEVKLYVNPQCRGRGQTAALFEEALSRLGCERPWSFLTENVMTRGPELDELKYFSLDLKPGLKARIKVYLRHHEATSADLERVMSAAHSHRPGDAIDFCRAVVHSDGPFSLKAPATCFSLVEGDNERPSAATLYLPTTHYAISARLACRRRPTRQGSRPLSDGR
jgi:DMATS type aromatic prenyltransferase